MDQSAKATALSLPDTCALHASKANDQHLRRTTARSKELPDAPLTVGVKVPQRAPVIVVELQRGRVDDVAASPGADRSDLAADHTREQLELRDQVLVERAILLRSAPRCCCCCCCCCVLRGGSDRCRFCWRRCDAVRSFLLGEREERGRRASERLVVCASGSTRFRLGDCEERSWLRFDAVVCCLSASAKHARHQHRPSRALPTHVHAITKLTTVRTRSHARSCPHSVAPSQQELALCPHSAADNPCSSGTFGLEWLGAGEASASVARDGSALSAAAAASRSPASPIGAATASSSSLSALGTSPVASSASAAALGGSSKMRPLGISRSGPLERTRASSNLTRARSTSTRDLRGVASLQVSLRIFTQSVGALVRTRAPKYTHTHTACTERTSWTRPAARSACPFSVARSPSFFLPLAARSFDSAPGRNAEAHG